MAHLCAGILDIYIGAQLLQTLENNFFSTLTEIFKVSNEENPGVSAIKP